MSASRFSWYAGWVPEQNKGDVVTISTLAGVRRAHQHKREAGQ